MEMVVSFNASEMQTAQPYHLTFLVTIHAIQELFAHAQTLIKNAHQVSFHLHVDPQLALKFLNVLVIDLIATL